jgi:hypothetical protein
VSRLRAKRVEYVGEGVDRLITVDMGARGIIYKLYEAARELTKAPLTLTAAQLIKEVVKPRDFVLITTGFRPPPNFIQETDGPLGAVTLARALSIAFDAQPLLLIEEFSKNILIAALRGIGIDVVATNKPSAIRAGQAAVLSFPIEFEKAEDEAESLLNEYNPSLVVAIEKAGRNKKGKYHNMGGLDVSPYHAKIEPLFEKAHKCGALTIGIGDGGNEVGMGNIREAVEKFVPYGHECQCPCKGGLAAESKVDTLVVSAISNWGGYGIEACIAYIADKPEALHKPQHEEAILKSAVGAGAIDGIIGRAEQSVDNVRGTIHSVLIDVLCELIKK